MISALVHHAGLDHKIYSYVGLVWNFKADFVDNWGPNSLGDTNGSYSGDKRHIKSPYLSTKHYLQIETRNYHSATKHQTKDF